MEEKNKYTSNLNGKCPVCGNIELEYLEYFDYQLSGSSIYYRWNCPKCEAEGEEWYELHFVGHVVYTKKKDENNKEYWGYEDVNDYILPEGE